jgi:hypothetical protein
MFVTSMNRCGAQPDVLELVVQEVADDGLDEEYLRDPNLVAKPHDVTRDRPFTLCSSEVQRVDELGKRTLVFADELPPRIEVDLIAVAAVGAEPEVEPRRYRTP